MKLLLILLLSQLVGTLNAWPQIFSHVRVKGLITDKDSQQPLAAATVTLLNASDSSRAASALTDEKGGFVIEGIKSGKYHLNVTYVGYQPILRPVEIAPEDTLVDLGIFAMQGTGVTLKAVEIVQVRAPMVVKRDTLEFNADYYKTRGNAMIEELLKILPGFQVAPDGTVRVNGGTVRRILVDGKPFFGDDPKMATRNLPADMIEKVQLIDQKSDHAQFTGIDGGRREKAINIVMKRDKKGNLLGRMAAGYGTNERFAGNVSLNRFSDNEQLSFIGNANNINNTAFLDGDGQRMAGENNGIARIGEGGFNYSTDLSKKLRINGSYVVNTTHTENEEIRSRQNLLQDTTYYYNTNMYTINNKLDHTLRMRIEYNIDTMHHLVVAGYFNYSNADYSQESIYQTLGDKGQQVNNGVTYNNHKDKTPIFSPSIFWERKFKKRGRTLRANLNMGLNNNMQSNYNKSNNLFIQSTGETEADTIDQQNNIAKKYRQTSISLSYSEPIFKDRLLEFSYDYIHDHILSNKETYDYNVHKRVYDKLNDSLSNYFKQNSHIHRAILGIHTQKNKFDYSLGFTIQTVSMNYLNVSQQTSLEKLSTNFFPYILCNYTFSDNARLKFYYAGDTQFPNIDQLQPVPDNSNPLYIQRGNPDLKMIFTHNFNLGYNTFNPQKMRAFIADLNASIYKGKIINVNWFDSVGRQVSQQQNVNGAFNVTANLANSFPLKKQQTSINLNTALGFNKDISFINGVKGSMNNFNIVQGLSFNYTHKALFNFSTTSSVSYSGTRYSLQKGNNINYFNYAFLFNCNVNIPFGLSIGCSLDYRLNTGRAAGYNQDATLLNAFVSKSLFKRNQGLIKLLGFDLLKQNLSISRNVVENYTEDVYAQVLQRFFMFNFTYFLQSTPTSKNK